MPKLTPVLSSQLAYLPYQLISNTDNKYLKVSGDIKRQFIFNKEKASFHGKTGGIFGIGRKSEGFALVGIGKGKYKEEMVVTVRGTKTIHNWITNGNIGLKGSPNGAIAHSGFVNAFYSIKPDLKRFILSQPHMPKHIHCVGHSLGGALASLVSDWVTEEFKIPVSLYTFGAPRIGQESYARKSESRNTNIFRCTHGADPVPLIPLWPFIHAPFSNKEYRLDDSCGLYFSTHGMGPNDVPGYINTANCNSWDELKEQSVAYLNKPVRLNFDNRHQAAYTSRWANLLSAALVTLLNDAGPRHAKAMEIQARLSGGMTFYDKLAKELEGIVSASDKLRDQTIGLLGHMLVFAGRSVSKITDLSSSFIRWVFKVTIDKLYSTAKQAFDSIF